MRNTIKSRFTSVNTIFSIILVCIIYVQISNAQWVQVSNGLGTVPIVRALAYSGDTIFAGTLNRGVYRSTNYGTNWTQTPFNNQSVYSLTVNGNNVFAGTNSNVYKSTDNGQTWSPGGLNARFVASLAIKGDTVFAGTYNYGVYLSTDNGTSWNQTSLNNQYVISLAIKGDTIFAGTNNSVYKSTNNGTNWVPTFLNTSYVNSLAIKGDTIFAGTTDNGVYKSSNNGTNWTQTSLNNVTVWSLAVNGNNIFAGVGGGGVYVSNDNGTIWTQWNTGMGNSTVYGLCIASNYIFAGVAGGGAYRRPLSELTGIHPISNKIPEEFNLSQNYPNPFNPSTKISFSLPSPSEGGVQYVTLEIYDLIGRKVESLINMEGLAPGTYEVEWNASNYSSGVYFYKLIADSFIGTKKLILFK